MLKKFFVVLFLILFPISFAKAVCPICTVAVGAGIGLTRWLGVDDLISGTWIGGLIVSITIWTLDWLAKRQKKFKLDWLVIALFYYVIIIAPLYYYNIMGHALNKFLGIDRLLFGIITGTLVFLFGVWLNDFLKQKNQGKQYFNYQKVVIPVSSLIIASLIFYLI